MWIMYAGRFREATDFLRCNINPSQQAAWARTAGQAFSIHSWAGSLWNFHTRFGPAITLR